MEHVEKLGCPEVWDCARSLTTIQVARNGVRMSALRIPNALTMPLVVFHEQTLSLFFSSTRGTTALCSRLMHKLPWPTT